MPKLIIVSNRLPINVSGKIDDKWMVNKSSGGLVSALTGLQKTTDFIWLGWPGIDVQESEREKFSNFLLKEHSSLPVFIDQHTSDLHYNGYSNTTIWPLFHYKPGEVVIDDKFWDGYERANKIFSEHIDKIAEDGDIIWIHDYHLMLLPSMVRERSISAGKALKIGFFLHIPFPTSEVYRVLPQRKNILEGVLSADLIGFHTYDYARHFIVSCTRILGLNSSPGNIEYRDRNVRIGAYPVGVEPENFFKALDSPEVLALIDEMKDKFKNLKIIVGVERLDYIKGIIQKLLAFEEFLETNQDMVGKVILIQIAIPSRTDVFEYQILQNQVFELIGRINGKYSTLTYYPIHFINGSLKFNELVALYHLGDVCLITSTRDGMNLVALEYIVSNKRKSGTLILSEFAGCSQSLNGAILINPWDLDQIKESLVSSLNLNEVQKQNDFNNLFNYVCKFTSNNWSKVFLYDLWEIKHSINHLCDLNNFNFKPAEQIILIEESELNEISAEEMQKLLKFNLVLRSASDHVYDESQYPEHCDIISKYGLFYRGKHLTDWKIDEKIISIGAYLDELKPIMNFYKERLPISIVEFSEYYVSWKLVETDTYLEWMTSELQMNLGKYLSHLPLKIVRRNNEILICHSSIDLTASLAERLQLEAQKLNCTGIIFISNLAQNFHTYQILSGCLQKHCCLISNYKNFFTILDNVRMK